MSSAIRFVGRPDSSLKCCVCQQVAREPWQHEECGKVLCQKCMEMYQRRPCPSCRGTISLYHRDKKRHDEIQTLLVRCGKFQQGCDWTGTLKSLQDHMTKCRFNIASKEAHHLHTPTKPNNDGYINSATATIERNLVRSISEGGYQRDYNSHMYEPLFDNECPVEGKYSSRTSGNLQDMLRQWSQQISELERTVESLQSEIATLKKHKQSYEHVMKETEDLMVTVPEFTQKKSANMSYVSPSFTAYHSGGYKLKLQVFPGGDRDGRGSHLSVFVRLVSGPCHNKLKWPFVGTVSIKLLNQIADKNHICRQISFNETDRKFPGSELGVAKFIAHKDLSCQGSVQYLVDNTIHFLVGVVHHQRGSATLV